MVRRENKRKGDIEKGRIGWEGGRKRQERKKGGKEQSYEGSEDAGRPSVGVIKRTTQN